MEGGIAGMPDVGGEQLSTGSEGKEVSQEDLVRVSESVRKAAQIGGQIRDDQQKNAQLALFLEFLFSEIKDDKIWETIIALCTVPDSTGKTLTLALHEMIALFAPFFPKQIGEYGIDHLVAGVTTIPVIQIDTYTTYIRSLRSLYPLIAGMDNGTIASFIVLLLSYFGYIHIPSDAMEETKTSIVHYLVL